MSLLVFNIRLSSELIVMCLDSAGWFVLCRTVLSGFSTTTWSCSSVLFRCQLYDSRRWRYDWQRLLYYGIIRLTSVVWWYLWIIIFSSLCNFLFCAFKDSPAKMEQYGDNFFCFFFSLSTYFSSIVICLREWDFDSLSSIGCFIRK